MRRLALIGDSLAVGLGPSLAPLVTNDLVQFQFEGAVGTTAKQWATSSPACGSCGSWLKVNPPTWVLVSLGSNDIGQSASGLEAQRPYYNKIIQMIQSTGAVPLWLQPPGVDVRLNAVRSFIQTLGVSTFSSEGISISPDGIHPSNYARWASEIWGWVKTLPPPIPWAPIALTAAIGLVALAAASRIDPSILPKWARLPV